MSRIKAKVRSISQKSGTQGVVKSVMAGCANVRLSSGGRVLHGIKVIGGPVSVGDVVAIGYQDGIPYIKAEGSAGGGDTTVFNIQGGTGTETPPASMDPLSAAGWTLEQSTGVLFKNGIYINPAGSLRVGDIGTGLTDYHGFWVGKDGGSNYDLAIGSHDGTHLQWDGDTGALNISGSLLTITGDIQSSDFVAGSTGWKISYNGDAEFSNINIRGTIKAAVFEYGSIQATAGTLGIFKSAGKLQTGFTTPASTSTSFTIDVANRNEQTVLYCFEVGDLLRAQIVVGNAIKGFYGIVSGTIVDHTTYATYTIAAGWSGPTSTAFPEGTAIADYGPTGSGFITLSADTTYGASANLSIGTITYTTLPPTENLKVRLGNMNGVFGTGNNNRYGIGIGNYAGGNYLSYNAETADTFVIKAGGGNVILDQYGLSLNAGLGATNSISFKSGANTLVLVNHEGFTDGSTGGDFYTMSEYNKNATTAIQCIQTSASYFANVVLLAADLTSTKYNSFTLHYKDSETPDGYASLSALNAGAASLRIQDGLIVGDVTTDPGTGVVSILKDGSSYGLKIGASGDVHLYRGAANVFDTPDSLRIGVGLAVGNNSITPSADNLTVDGGATIGNDITADPIEGRLLVRSIYTLTGNMTDAYCSLINSNPTYTAASAYTLDRHNYINLAQPATTNVTITNACAIRFDTGPGTHKAVDSGTTKTTPGTVNAWMKINIGGVLYYIPCYTSKTS